MVSKPKGVFCEKDEERVDLTSKASILLLLRGITLERNKRNNNIMTTGKYIITAMKLNHRGGVTSRSYYQVDTMEEVNTKMKHLSQFYNRVEFEEAK